MKAIIKIVYMIGAAVCSILAVILRIAAPPVVLICSALEAMADTLNGAASELLEKSRDNA